MTLVANRQLSSRIQWSVVALAWSLVFFGFLAWVLGTPPFALREQLKHLQFWWLEASVALAIVFCGVVLTELVRRLDRRDLSTLAALTLVAIVLTVFVAPRTNRIYYDEQIYQGIGQNLADLRLAQMCNEGSVEYGRLQCTAGEYNKQPYAYPHVLSLAYRVFGVREGVAFAVNAAVMAATVCAVYLLGLVLFSDRLAASFAALLITLIPHQILWSATAAVEPSSSLACVVALLFAAHAARSGTSRAIGAAAIATAYAVQFRPESMLIVPVAAVLVWMRARDELARPRFWWWGLVAFLLMAVHLAHTFVVRNESWGTSDARLSLAYVAGNLRVNGLFYVADERFPVVITCLALIGLATRGFVAERLALTLYGAAFFGIQLLFYAGSYNYGADVRYSVMTYPPLVLLGGLGLSSVVRWIGRFNPPFQPQRLAAAALAFQFLWYMPLVRATTDEAWAARADVRFARSIAPDLRGNAYVLTHNPSMFHVWGVSAGQMSQAVSTPSPSLDYLGGRYAGGVYVHWNYWCNAQDDLQRSFCANALKARPVELVREYREGNQRFALYRFGPASGH